MLALTEVNNCRNYNILLKIKNRYYKACDLKQDFVCTARLWMVIHSTRFESPFQFYQRGLLSLPTLFLQ